MSSEVGGISNINMVNTGEGIKLVPNWTAAMQILLAVLEDGNELGKQQARDELIQMARRMDRFADEIRAARGDA